MFSFLFTLAILYISPMYPALPLLTENCKGEMKNNIKSGYWQCFYDDGNLMQEGNYTNGKKEGIWKLYHANGKLAGEGPYANDAEKGKWKFFDDEGKLILEQEY